MNDLTAQVREALEERARGHDGERLRGRCQVLSLGDDCPCRLCFAQETAAAVARVLEAVLDELAPVDAGPGLEARDGERRELERLFLAALREEGRDAR